MWKILQFYPLQTAVIFAIINWGRISAPHVLLRPIGSAGQTFRNRQEASYP